MGSPKCFFLLNCDNTYDLDVVEKFLEAVNGKTTEIEIRSKKEYFRLGNMSELTKTIGQSSDGPKMDCAIFVVNAHESRLSINEENAGIGYAQLYKALLRATGERVIVIIGGDDNYKNATEEDGSILSRWARRKVSSQFEEEFMDGTKGFIFSWDKKHRVIHEEALLHFLDSNKKGEKFVYEKKTQAESLSPSVDQKQKTEVQEAKIPKKGALEKHAAGICQGQKDVNTSGPITEKDKCDDRGAKSEEEKETIHDQSMDAVDKDKTKHWVHGRNQSDLHFIQNLFGDELLGKAISFSSGPPKSLRELLEPVPANSVGSCFIVLDGKDVEELASQYEDLLLYARNKVDKKIVLIICKNNRPIDEEIITAKSADILKDKVWVLWSTDLSTPPLDTLVLKTRLQNGAISYEQGDVKYRKGDWTPPIEIENRLSKEGQSADDVELAIYAHEEDGTTTYRVITNNLDSWYKRIRLSVCLPFLGERRHTPPPPSDTIDALTLD
ncbi:uncharacterized protein LOC111344637 [Stylophora pistillata]|uniref:Uncharacterized protein n=1 Tax=Stylophora pistillata TaxID=50429 RepID=A0A2B4RE53_STYPI|nr:uncharacterized protein LOC111344637 [Stylophora pistillata]PFX14555.1 hypothetical protein AWC38_SpisGene21270 [Stylophora pistillata]